MKPSIITIYFILAASIYSGSQLHAQTPGYAGKKLTITTNLDASLALYKRLRLDWVDATNPIGPRFGLNKRFGAGLEYTVGKQLILGASVKHANILYPWIYVSKTTELENHVSIDTAYFGDINISTNYVNCYIKKFNFHDNGNLAPIGNYHKFGFSLLKAHGETGPEHERNYSAIEYLSLNEDVYLSSTFEKLGFTESVVIGIISYGYGGQTIIFDRILVGCDMEFSLPVTGNVYHEDYNLDLNYGQSSFKIAMAKRMYTASWLIVNFQIGLVAL